MARKMNNMCITIFKKICLPYLPNWLAMTFSKHIQKKYFALLCAETKDCGKDEQLSVCIRYAERILYEEFYDSVSADGLDAQSVMIKLKGVLASMGVDARTHLFAQCYDCASVMCGRLN